MEKLQAQLSNVKKALSRQPNELWSAGVVRALVLCALHFRVELTDADFEVYKMGLREIGELERIEAAFTRCIKECEFMPRLKDILERIPDREIVNAKPDLKVVREWDEPYGDKTLHYIEYENGYKQARFA